MRNFKPEKENSEPVRVESPAKLPVNIEQKTFAVADLDAVSAVHIEAFPSSAWTKLGSQVVRNYYDWQISGNHPLVTAKVVYADGVCAGFLVAGVFRDSTSGFLWSNRELLARKLLLKPRLLLNPEFRGSFYAGCRILKNYVRRQRAKREKSVSERRETKSYGILAIAVSPRRQGLGIGKMLMETAENTALSEGFTKMNLTVNPSNTKAIKFYERLNWERVSVNDNWKGLMEKKL